MNGPAWSPTDDDTEYHVAAHREPRRPPPTPPVAAPPTAAPIQAPVVVYVQAAPPAPEEPRREVQGVEPRPWMLSRSGMAWFLLMVLLTGALGALAFLAALALGIEWEVP